MTSLEELEKEIYGFKKTPEKPKKEEKPEEKIEEKKEEKHSFEIKTKKRDYLFIFFITINLLVIIGGSFLIFFSLKTKPTRPLVEIEINHPFLLRKGVPFNFEVNISNQSNIILKNASLILNLPSQGLFLSNQNSEIREEIGDIGSGSVFRKKFEAVVNQELKDKIKVLLVYNLDSKQRFEQIFEKEINIEKSGFEFEIEAPQEVLSGVPFEIVINYKNNSGYNFEDLFLETEPSPTFKFLSSNFQPDSPLNNFWRLGALNAGSSGKLIIQGVINSPQKSFFSLPVTLGNYFLGQKIILERTDLSILINPSPISVSVLINNKTDYVARIGESLVYTLKYKNNTEKPLNNLVIKIKLLSDLFDFQTIQTRGEFDALTNTLVWSSQNLSELRKLNPGETGSLNFSVRLVSNFPIKNVQDKNFLLKIEGTIDSLSEKGESQRQADFSLETKVSGYIIVDTQVFYRDPASKILNTGPMPPRIGQATQYTVHFFVRVYGVDVRDVEVRTFLENGVSWKGVTKSNTESLPEFNEMTKEVVWRIDKIQANKGVVNDPLEAVFQIEAIPSQNHLGQYQPLITRTLIRAFDEFAGLTLENFDVGVNSSLPDDQTINKEEGRVIK